MHDQAWDAEQACLNAWPAARTVFVGDWMVRASGGPIRRTNSANPLRGGDHDPARVLSEVRNIFGRLDQPCIFRVPTLVGNVHGALDDAGFLAPEAETCTLLADLAGRSATLDPSVTLAHQPTVEWLAARAEFNAADETVSRIYREMLDAIAGPAAFAMTRSSDGRVASIAYGAVSRGMIIIESVATRPSERRQGHSRRVVSAVLSWAAMHGVPRACLQVVADNTPALELYRSIGFTTELYRYVYRRLATG